MDMVTAGSPPVGRNWRAAAACLNEDPELFFPLGSTGPSLDQIDEAKAVCVGCPVRTACLEWALQAGPDAAHGVWGGLDEDERRSVRRRRAAHRTRTAKAAEVAA
jgi:WhiB family redox-sensing transcriptional regulator